MAALTAEKVIPRVRHRLGVSQEGLSRLLNATKGAVQHWERGRNNPDLGRLLALRRLCPPGPERKELDALIRQTQAEFAPVTIGKGVAAGAGTKHPAGRYGGVPGDNAAALRRANERLARQVAKLEDTLDRRNEALRILEDLATELKKDMARPRAK
jgi:transcriptional regulator with XRE-family HTH domain